MRKWTFSQVEWYRDNNELISASSKLFAWGVFYYFIGKFTYETTNS